MKLLDNKKVHDLISCRTCKSEKTAPCVLVVGDEDLWVGCVHESRYVDALELEDEQ